MHKQSLSELLSKAPKAQTHIRNVRESSEGSEIITSPVNLQDPVFLRLNL